MRTPKPYFKKSHNAWYVNLRGKNVRLAADEKAAYQQYYILMAATQEIKPSSPARAVIGRFLEWARKHKKPTTYDFYRRFLESFGKSLKPKLLVRDLKPHHVHDWIDATYPHAGSSHKHNAVRAAKRPFAWAEEEGHIERSPLARMRNKFPPRRREVYVQPEQFATILAAVRDQPFRDVLVMLRRTGCRPQELRRAEARHFDRRRGALDFPVGESKGERERRVVLLDSETRGIVERLALQHPEGPLFRNRRGEPWRKDALVLRFTRLSEKLGIKATPYTIRHIFATEALARGVPLAVVAQLMGHKDYKMLQEVYGHLERKSDVLRQALDRALA